MIPTLPILSVEIADVVYGDLFSAIENAIDRRDQTVIMYASVHSLNLAHDDPSLARALQEADLVHPDGIGVWLSSKVLHGRGFRDRFNWSDHALEFLAACASRHWRIFLLGATAESLAKAVTALHDGIPHLNVVGWKNGFEDAESASLIQDINEANPDILWVGMGTPKQERWIRHHRHELRCSVIQSVGDAISLIAGDKVRGPKLFQMLGLEWAFRVMDAPGKYFGRYVFGIPRFAALIFKAKMSDRPPRSHA